MTGSSPADLAVTFRSIDRRLREALTGRPPNDAAAAPVAELDRRRDDRRGRTSGLADGGSLQAAGRRHRRAIERVSADDWDGAQLESPPRRRRWMPGGSSGRSPS